MPNTITGDDGASAISPMLAVDEDWVRASLDDREHLRNLFVCRSANSRHRYVGISDAHVPRFFFLCRPNIVGHPQIDNGSDTLLAKLPISRRTLGNWKAKGFLPYIKTGRRCLYDWASVQGALLRRQRGGQW